MKKAGLVFLAVGFCLLQTGLSSIAVNALEESIETVPTHFLQETPLQISGFGFSQISAIQ